MSEFANTILFSVSGSKGAVWADSSGNVLETAGDIDAETVSAVAAISLPMFDEIGDLLGLGNLEGWSVVTKSQALYVHQQGGGLVIVSAATTKNPETILKKLA